MEPVRSGAYTPRSENRDLPGYPHYPPADDIMNPQNGMHKVSADEALANSSRLSRDSIKNSNTDNGPEEEDDNDDLEIVRGTEADVTPEDLELLGDKDEDMDMGDDELLRSRSRVDEVEEDDLDIPGAELDDPDEAIGEEDEENNYYSLGGDRHESLEEDPS